MQIFIKSFPNEAGIDEYALIELQGDIESKSNEPLAGKLMGDLHYTKAGVPVLIVGHHILYGEVQKIPKPFAVLEKGISSAGKTEYIVKSLIKRKLIFSLRPKPRVTSIPKKL